MLSFQIHNFGTKFMYISGIMVAGSSAALMGVLQYCPPGSFVAMCFLARLVEGLGASAVVTCKCHSSVYASVLVMLKAGLNSQSLVIPLIHTREPGVWIFQDVDLKNREKGDRFACSFIFPNEHDAPYRVCRKTV